MEAAAASGKPKGVMSAFRGLVSARSPWRASPALAPLRLTGRAHRAAWAGRLSRAAAARRARAALTMAARPRPRPTGGLQCGRTARPEAADSAACPSRSSRARGP